MTSYSRQQATVMESLRCGDKMEHFCDDRLRKSCVTQVDRFMQIVDMNCEDVIVPTSAIHKYEFKEEVQEPAEQSACDNNFRHCKIEMDYDDTPITVVVKQEPTEEQSTVDPLTAGNQTTCDQTAGNQTACDQTACNQTAGDQTSCDQTAGDQTVIKKTAGDQTAIKKTGAKKKGPKKTAFKKTTAKETGANQTAVNQTAANQTAVNQTAANQTAVNQTAGSIEHYVAAPLVSQVAAFSHMAVPVYPGTPSNMCNHADIICGNLYGVCDCTVVVRTIDVHTSTATCWLVHNGIVQQDIEMTVPVCRLQEVPEVARLGLADRNLQVSLHGMPVESAMSRTTSGHSISEETSQYERNISRQNLPPAQKGDAAQFRTSQEVAACTSSSQPLCLASNNSALLHCMSKNVKHMPEDVKEIDVCGYPFQYIIHEDKIYFSCQDSFNICGIWKFVRNKGYGGIVTILNRYNCVDDGVFCVNMRTRWIRRDALLLLLLDNKSFPKSNKRKAVLLREVLKMKGSEAEEKVLKRKLEEACLDSEPPCRAKKAMMPNGVDLPSQMQDAAAVGLPQAGIYGSPYMGMEDRSAPTWQNINMTPVSAPILISPRVNGRGHLHPPASSSDHLPASGVRWTHVTVGGPRPDSAAGITPHSDPAVSEAWPDFAVGKVQEQEDSLDCTRPEVAGTRPDNANIDDSASPTGIQPAPSPAGIQPTPSPAGIQPTPSPTGIQPTPSPAGIQPAPSPAGIQPTPSKRGKSSDPSDAVSSQGMIELLGRNVLYKTHQGKIFLSLPPLFKELQLDKHIQNAGYSFIDRRIESSGLKKCDCFLTKDNLLRQRTHIWARAMLKILGCMKMGNKEKKMQLRYDILAALENMAASNSGKAFGQGQDKW